MTTSESKWQAFHQRRATSGRRPRWPNETMLRVLFGNDYLRERPPISSNTRVLDIGCGFGNNLLPFLDLGCACVGVEIDPGIVEVARDIAREQGSPATFEVGSNRSLPFPDASFDLLLSIDTLHYERSRSDADAAMAEFARVLKPNGALFLTTVGPLHDIYVTAEQFPDGRFTVRNYDFRSGETMFCFRTEEALGEAFGKHFSVVETGRSTQHLMRANLDWLIAVAQRKH